MLRRAFFLLLTVLAAPAFAGEHHCGELVFIKDDACVKLNKVTMDHSLIRFPSPVEAQKDGLLWIVSGKGADGVHGVPQREGHVLGQAVVEIATQHPCASIAGRGRVGGEAGISDVLGVSRGVLGAHGTAPATRDHRNRS